MLTASLGGIYKRQERFEESLTMYNQAVNVSKGHPYPLLNAIKLQVMKSGLESVTDKQRFLLGRKNLCANKYVISHLTMRLGAFSTSSALAFLQAT